MTLNELAFYTATFGDCGSFDKITEIGWNSEEQFFTETAKRMQAKWSHYDDGRSVMTTDKTNGDAGWACKFIVKDGWLATLDYAQLERQMMEPQRQTAKIITTDYADDNPDYDDDDDDATQDYGLEDYNDDYGWWR